MFNQIIGSLAVFLFQFRFGPSRWNSILLYCCWSYSTDIFILAISVNSSYILWSALLQKGAEKGFVYEDSLNFTKTSE